MSDPSVEDLRQKTDEVKGQMASNLDAMRDREDNLDQVERSSRRLNETSHLFSLSAKSLQRKYCFKNVKLWIILMAIIAVILITLIIALIIVVTSTTNSGNQ